ncbi:MAG TPA: hypothetical protein VIL55_11680 [Naasia sp.]|jgi:hypothetical protein
MDPTTLPRAERPTCEPDMTVPLRAITDVGPGGASLTSTYARCLHCGRDFPVDAETPRRCYAARAA